MKRILLLIISICMALAVTGSAFAHPGRTDSQGGHTDRSTGEYHYHHGYPAHQHEDRDGDGIKEYCPYDFNDKTGTNSGTSSSRTTVTPVTTPASVPKITIRATTPPATTTPTTRATTAAVYSAGIDRSYNLDWGDSTVAILVAIIAVIYAIVSASQKNDLRSNVQVAKGAAEHARTELKEKEANYNKRVAELLSMYGDEAESKRKYINKSRQLEEQLRDAQLDVQKQEEGIRELSDRLSKESCKTMQAEKNYKQLQDEFSTTMEKLHKIGDPEEGQTEAERILFLAQRIQEKDEKIQALSAELDRHIQREKIPDDVFYADDGMPVLLKSVAKKYGDYSVYLNHYTGVYHGDQACAPYGAQEVHLFKVLRSPNARPCTKCAKQLPIRVPDWWDARK